MSTRLFLLTAAMPGLVPCFSTVPASLRLPRNEVPAIERGARFVPGFPTALALQSGLRGLVFFDNCGYRFLGCHSHGFGLLGRYSHSFRQSLLMPFQLLFAPSLLLLRSVGLALRSHVAPSLLLLRSVKLARRTCLNRRFELRLIIWRSFGLARRICLDRRFGPSLILWRSFGLARRICLDRRFEPSLVLWRSFGLARWR